MTEPYVELHARSAFSFLEGASLPEELIHVCAELGAKAMALLDRDGVYGSPRFHLAAKKIGVKAHIGSEVTLAIDKAHGSKSTPKGSRIAGRSLSTTSFPLLVQNRTGYQNLCRLITLIK